MLNYQRGKSRRQCFDWLGHWSKSKESLCHVPPLSHRLRGTLCSHQWNWWRWRGCTGRPEGWQKSLPYFAKGLRTYPQIFHNFGMFERFNLETPQLYPKYTKSIHLPPKILEFPMFSNIWLRHASLIRSSIPPSPRRSSGWCKPWSEREFRAASPTIDSGLYELLASKRWTYYMALDPWHLVGWWGRWWCLMGARCRFLQGCWACLSNGQCGQPDVSHVPLGSRSSKYQELAQEWVNSPLSLIPQKWHGLL